MAKLLFTCLNGAIIRVIVLSVTPHTSQPIRHRAGTREHGPQTHSTPQPYTQLLSLSGSLNTSRTTKVNWLHLPANKNPALPGMNGGGVPPV